MKKYIVLILITIILIVFGISFIDHEDSSTANVNLKQGITYGIESIPNNLRDTTELLNSDEDILCALTIGIVEKNENGEIVPALDSEINKSDDGIEYEFKIRNDVFWSNGSKVTAKDVVVFFKEILKEYNDEEIKCILNVYGAKDFRDGKLIFDKGVAISYKDDCVTIRLNNKYDEFLEELCKPQYRIRNNIVMWDNIIKNYNNLDYCGAYKIKDIDKESVVLERNNDSVKFKYINFIKDGSVEQSMASYEINERDIVVNPPESELNKLKSDDKLITLPKALASYIVINNTNIPIDGRRALYNSIYTALEEYQSNNKHEFDLAEGCYFREEKDNLTMIQQRKVDSNKKVNWTPPQVLTIIAEDNKQNKILCRIIKEWFANNTDMVVKYSLENEEEFNDINLKKKYDIIITNNEAIASQKELFYSSLEDYFSDTDLDLIESLRINDYYGDYYTLEESLFYNYNIMPLVFYNKNIAVSDKISQVGFDGNGNIDFDKLN